MKEREAATFLKISPRTLYRYRKSGKIAFREAPGKTRPTIEYDDTDVELLKSELDERRAIRVKPAKIFIATAKRVSLTLPGEVYDELSQEAATYAMSPGEFARRLVREGLESSFQAEAAELHAAVNRIHTEVKHVRSDFAAGFESLLEYVGLTADDAKKWVAENLR